MATVSAQRLVKPRLGMRRTKGICPPSKIGDVEEPEREPCPLLPRPAVLPWPEPGPRPMRFRVLFLWIP